MNNKKTLIYFSLFPYESDLLHREHQLSRELSSNYDVYYVERVNSFLPLGSKISSRDSLKVITVKSLPYFKGKFTIIYKINDWLLSRQFNTFLVKLPKIDCAISSNPNWAEIIKKVFVNTGTRVIYDISDDLSKFATNESWRKNLIDYESKMISMADKVVVTSENLKFKVKDKNVILITNGVDMGNGAKLKRPIEYEIDKKTIGFIGGIFEWVDLDLFYDAAKSFPGCEFYLIGPTNQRAKIDAAVKLPNVKYLGVKNKNEIDRYFKYLDIGLIPFVDEDKYPRLLTVDSNKVYQYSRWGYPVVSTSFAQIDKLKDFVYVSATKDEFICNLGEAIQDKSASKKAKRVKFAEDNSWGNKASEYVSEIENVLK